jgi:hypothetical protein
LGPGLNELLKLNPVSFYYKPDTKLPAALQYGLIADDVSKIDPNLAVYTATTTEYEGKTYPIGTPQGLAPENTWIGLFVKSIQDQQKEIQNITVGKVKRSAEENWQDILIGALICYAVYNEVTKKR